MDEELPTEEESPRPASKKRLLSAIAAYAVLAGLACVQLHGKVLYGVLILFGGLAAKTVIADRAGWR
jgi:hypothetical protein